MKKILALSLALMLLLTLCACGDGDAKNTTAATTTTASAAPTTSPTTAPTTTTTTPTTSAPSPEDEALQIAKDLLDKYNWYCAVGACCDMEYVDENLRGYLSEEQKDIYVGAQQQILCCKNAEEVNGHLHKLFSDRLITSYPEDLLFSDAQDHLYLIIFPTSLPSYQNHRLISYNVNFITMEADCYETGDLLGTVRVFCSRTSDGFILEEYVFTSANAVTMTEDEAMEIAMELMGGYIQYASLRVCCESEYVVGDFSEYLTDEQKDIYIGSQHLIKCCHTAQEVKAHIDRTMQEFLLDGDSSHLLFSNDDGNLYVIMYPSEYIYHTNYRVAYFDDNTIILEGDDYDSDEGRLDGIGRLTCVRTDAGFVVEEYNYIRAK